MPKASSIEQQLDALAAIRSDPDSEPANVLLAQSLLSKSNLVVAKAAMIIASSRQTEFLPRLAVAFDRSFAAGADKGCVSKTALATALYELGHNDSSPFLRGIRYCEPRGGFGHDVAAELRGICGLGLARMGYPDVLLELASLLVDAEPQTRIMGIRAAAYTGSDAGAPLLRMKVLAGDVEPDVTAECLTALMKVSPKKSLPFVGEFLGSGEPIMVEAAAQAIGSWRSMTAFEFLHAEWGKHLMPEPRRPLLLAMAMTRQPAAIDFLLERIVDDRPAPASDAVAALAMYKHDDAVTQHVKKQVEQANESLVTAAFLKAFGDS